MQRIRYYVLDRFNFSNSFVMRFDHALENRNINVIIIIIKEVYESLLWIRS